MLAAKLLAVLQNQETTQGGVVSLCCLMAPALVPSDYPDVSRVRLKTTVQGIQV